MPKTKSYLNPNCNQLYSNYVKYSDVEEIANDLDQNFDYLVLLKKKKVQEELMYFIVIREVKQ